jgi:hydroxylamine dehydrogenase
MKPIVFVTGICLLITCFSSAAENLISEATSECIECHITFQPGIVADWQKSRHAATTPAQAMQADELALKVSNKAVPETLRGTAVGCAECHMLRPDAHADTFEHNGYDIHIVVSPKDCSTCHTVEAEQYSKNLMAHAYKNLDGNTLYQKLQRSILGKTTRSHGKVHFEPESDMTKAEGCYYCHGTVLEVAGTETRDTDAAGELDFPIIKGWPNQGVGRINLDGSLGACTPCHTRHRFSLEMARKPYTCKECHVGPDVPVYKVYTSSKHGNLFDTHNAEWNFNSVPWTIGKDFTAPTCASCHISLLVNTEGEVVSQRSHQFNDRLPWRLFGLIYAHPYPRDPDTSIIRNAAGQPLPTDMNGAFAQPFLISEKEQQERTTQFQQICLSCHGTNWVNGFWQRFENTIQETNAITLTATQIMSDIWTATLADAENPFDEFSERLWCDQWLFYANTVRFASAMGGGGDYGIFADGRYQMTRGLFELEDWFGAAKKRKP